LKEELQKGAEIVVDMYGLDYESQAQEAESSLKEIESVSSVYRRFYLTGVGQFEVRFKGGAAGLAKALKYAEIDGQPLKIVETLPRYMRVERKGGRNVQGNMQETFNRYLKEKYKKFDMEKAREQDKELIGRIIALAQKQKVNDEQKKQLYATRKEIEEKRQEAFYWQKKLEKRKQELKKVKAEKKEFEDKYAKLSKEREETKALRQELGRARGGAYTATRNYSNASYYARSSAADYVGAVSRGLNLASRITSFF
jgi:hypothetical protein